MKRNFKGFTLIECLVALAILGIASLIMAQIYANVSRINRSNHNVNTSLSYQMRLVEEATKTDAIEVKYTESSDLANHKINSSSTQIVTLTKLDDNKQVPVSSQEMYYIGCDIYVLLSRDANDKSSSDADYNGDTEDNYNLRYKYILGHKPTP